MDYPAYGFADENVFKLFSAIFAKRFEDKKVDPDYIHLSRSKKSNIFDSVELVIYNEFQQKDLLPKFYLVRHLGSGGYGAVFETEVTLGQSKKTYAVKFEYLQDYSSFLDTMREIDKLLYINDAEKVWRLKNSVSESNIINVHYRALYSFYSPYIGSLKPADELPDNYRICVTVMDMVNATLTDYIKSNFRGKKYAPLISDLLYITKQLFNIINLLTETKIIHRDIKDPNILIDSNKVLKLIDFGGAIYEEELKNEDMLFKSEVINTLKLSENYVLLVEYFKKTDPVYEYALDYMTKYTFNFPGTITNVAPEIILTCIDTNTIEHWYNSKVKWADELQTSNTVLEYSKALGANKVTVMSNVFSIGLVLMRLYFGFRPLWDYIGSDATVDTALLAHYKYMQKMLEFGEDEVSNDRKIEEEKLKDLETIYNENISLSDNQNRNDLGEYLYTFIEQMTKGSQKYAKKMFRDKLRSGIAYFISLLLLPNTLAGLKIKKGVKLRYMPALRRTNRDELDQIYLELFKLNTLTIAQPDRMFITKHAYPIKDELNLIQNYNIHEFKKRAMSFFDAKDFGIHNSHSYIHNSDEKYIKLLHIDYSINCPRFICGHKLNRMKFADYVLRNQHKIKENKVKLCYKCQHETKKFQS